MFGMLSWLGVVTVGGGLGGVAAAVWWCIDV